MYKRYTRREGDGQIKPIRLISASGQDGVRVTEFILLSVTTKPGKIYEKRVFKIPDISQ